MMSINFRVRPGQPKSLLAQVLTAVVGLIALVLGVMFSAVFLVVVVVAGLIFWAYFWWKTRAVRKHIREQMASQGFAQPTPEPAQDGDVIEGEAVRVVDEKRRLGE